MIGVGSLCVLLSVSPSSDEDWWDKGSHAYFSAFLKQGPRFRGKGFVIFIVRTKYVMASTAKKTTTKTCAVSVSNENTCNIYVLLFMLGGGLHLLG